MAFNELVDYFDTDGTLLGYCERERAEAENFTTANTIIFIFTPDGNVWLQHRAETKKHYPGLWDTSACGGMVHGETAQDSAVRELLEESGLHCELQFVETFLNTFPDESKTLTRKRFSHLFIGLSAEQPNGNHEVQSFELFDRGEALNLARTQPARFIPSMALELAKAIAGYERLVTASAFDT